MKTIGTRISFRFLNQVMLIGLTFLGPRAFGLEPQQYLKIDEQNSTFSQSTWKTQFLTPEQITQSTAQALGAASSYSLVKWVLFNAPPPQPTNPYDRRFHFGTWVNDPNDNTCYNTRAKVLIRDSKTPVTMKPNNKCVVESGAWNDPYTGQVFTQSSDIQIDHVVPLKHAYQAGAWKWDFKTRCLYANFMSDNYHLLSVNGRENMRKGDRSPAAYIPPNSNVTCGYLQAWLQIKLAWNLLMFPDEARAIQALISRNHCDPQKFKMQASELARLRRSMTELLPLCQRMATNRLNWPANQGSSNEISYPGAVTQ